MTTITELAKAWHAEIFQTAGTESIGDLMTLDRLLAAAPVETSADAVALLGVVIQDFRLHHEDADGDLEPLDGEEALLWKALNEAVRFLKPA